ncbi:hypothetical protein RLPCCGM1_c0707 [Rhizobium leguminosarum bv. phaseoli CCGM1]|nr:hypothetical protein RLPCCGM1_c0707 [Rhizobium leguminosarum bv. phaseoli CCGM1]
MNWHAWRFATAISTNNSKRKKRVAWTAVRAQFHGDHKGDLP